MYTHIICMYIMSRLMILSEYRKAKKKQQYMMSDYLHIASYRVALLTNLQTL